MKKYESYSAFSLGWSQRFPAHWKLLRLKRALQERKENNSPVKTKDILSLTNTRGVIPYAQKGNIGNKHKENIEDYHIAHPGDLVLNSMNVVIGSVGISEYYGAISPVYYALYPRGDENICYFGYIFSLPTFEETLKGLGNGIMEIRRRIPMIKLNNVVLPVPPRAEQDQIVRFLDWKTSRINRLINTYRKEIDKLEELKRSRIGSLVMGAAHPKQRQSEVSWVKTIPRHWEETKLIQVTHEQKIKNTGLVEKNLLSLSYGKIVNKDINTTDGLLPASFEGYQIVHPGNVILRLTDLQNDHKSLRTGYVTQTGIITSAYTCVKHRENISPEYLQLQLHTADLCKVFYGMGGGVRQSIGFDDIKKLVIALPPLSEQVKIVEKAHGIDARINTVASKYKGVISLLKEYKNRLISGVVTGQVDVRDVAIPEYERVKEIADSNPEDDEAELEEAESEAS